MEVFILCDCRDDAIRKLANKNHLKLVGDKSETREYYEKDYRAARHDPDSTEPKIRGEILTGQFWPIEEDVNIHFTEFSGGNVFYRIQPIGKSVEVYLCDKGKLRLVRIIEPEKD